MESQKTFLFVRGLPAAGKITVAKELEKQLGWKVVWLHAIKNAIYDIVKEHDLSELMRQVLEPIVEYLLQRGDSVIFVRPATETETVRRMERLVNSYPGYRFCLVTLTADREELMRRAIARQDPYRINNEERMDEYFSRSGVLEVYGPDELVIDTTGLTLTEVIRSIRERFQI